MGKSASPPPTPDYVGAAKEQGQQNLVSAQQSAKLSNPNMYTPFGTQTVTYSDPTFDQTRYDAEMQSYLNRSKSVNRDDFYEMTGGAGDDSGYQTFNQNAYENALRAVGSAPSRDAFMTGGGVPTITQTLTPEAQATLDAQMRVQRAMAGLSETGIGNAKQMLSTPFTPTSTNIEKGFADYGRAMNEVPLTTNIDTSNFSQMPLNAGTTAQDLILQRLNPTIEAGDKSFAQTLANQGLAPGTQAYNTAFRNREMSKNDLYSQAALQGIGLDMGARQQQLNEALGIGGFQNQAQLNRAGLYNSAIGQDFAQGLSRAQFGNQAQQQQLSQDLTLRGQPMNEIIGLLGGSQIQLPQFGGYQGTNIAPAPTFAATQAANNAAMQNYGIQQAGNNATTQGLASLGMAGAMYFSDRRLKSNIVRIGEHPSGIGIYEYDIFDRRERGVMETKLLK
jgi:hypothetical protein